MSKTSARFIQLTQPEIADAFQRYGRVIVPTGSVEQHGPHLPTGTDYYAALAIAERVAERLDALVLPFSPVGVTPMHMPFAGTLSLSPETFERVLVEIVAAAGTHGVREVLILNWHEGNIPSIALAAETLHRQHGLTVVVVQACYVAEEMFGSEAGGLTHGGEIEAWSVLCQRPDLVHLDRVAGGSDAERGKAMDRLRRTRSYQPVLTDVRTIAPSGWYGNPGPATPEKAQRFLESIARQIADESAAIFEQLASVQGGEKSHSVS